MLYNLIVMDANAGLNLVNIQMDQGGMDGASGQLASGMVKAIRDFLSELKMGSIKSFHTHQKQILVHKEGNILSVLIADVEDDMEPFSERIIRITNMFNESVDWSKWDGNINIFEPIEEEAKNILSLNDQDIIEHLEEHLLEIIDEHDDVLGYVIVNKEKIVKKNLDNVSDFELETFLSSNMFEMVIDTVDGLEDVVSNSDLKSLNSETFVDYQKFSIIKRHILNELSMIVILPGLIDPISDLPQYENKLKEIGGF